MSDRLCEMLVQQEEISREEANAAEARQVQMGGALDSALLEHGVDPGRLRMAMAQAYETRFATPEDLATTAEPRALRAFPEQWARRHQLVPLRLDDGGRVLTLLSPAPADLALLLRLGELLDLQLEPRIALELDAQRALSRIYELPLAPRFAALRPGARAMEVLPFREAKERLEVADSRDEVARALLGYSGSHIAYAALVVVQAGRIRGWMQSGPQLEVLKLDVPVDRLPGPARVLESSSLYIGPGDEALARELGREPSPHMVLAPLRIRDRTVALLYGDDGLEPVPRSFAEDLGLLMNKAQQSLEALLLRRKAETLSQLEAAAPAPEEDDTDLGALPIPEAVLEPEPTEAVPPHAPEPQPEAAAESIAIDGEPEALTQNEVELDESEDFDLPIEEPAFGESAQAELPDEPIYTEDEDDWEPVAVARANHAQGYELVAPHVVEAAKSPEPMPIATAPRSSRDLPSFLATTPAADQETSAPQAPLEIVEEPSPEEITWPEDASGPNFGSAEDWAPSPSPEWSDVGEGLDDPAESQPVLLTERVDEPSIDLGEDDGSDWVEQLGSGVRAQVREAREVLLERGPAVLPRLMAAFPGRLEVDPLGRAELPSFEACGPLLELVARFGRESHPHVAQKLEADDAAHRFFAAYFYSSVFVPEVIPRLIQRLHDGEPRVCMVAARTLFGYRDHPDFSLLLEHLHGRMASESPAARRHASYLVGLFRDVTAIPILIRLIEQKDRAVSDVAVDALAEITKQNFGPAPKRWRTWFERHGERSRIEWLIEGLSARESALRRSASDELRAVTGEDFGFDPEAPRRRREEVKARWSEWWTRQPDYQSSSVDSP